MGQELSQLQPTQHQFEFNEKLKISAWDTYPSKNAEYYQGNRYFKISRKYYPQYTRGYVWGYYEDENYYKCLEEPLERAF